MSLRSCSRHKTRCGRSSRHAHSLHTAVPRKQAHTRSLRWRDFHRGQRVIVCVCQQPSILEARGEQLSSRTLIWWGMEFFCWVVSSHLFLMCWSTPKKISHIHADPKKLPGRFAAFSGNRLRGCVHTFTNPTRIPSLLLPALKCAASGSRGRIITGKLLMCW